MCDYFTREFKVWDWTHRGVSQDGGLEGAKVGGAKFVDGTGCLRSHRLVKQVYRAKSRGQRSQDTSTLSYTTNELNVTSMTIDLTYINHSKSLHEHAFISPDTNEVRPFPVFSNIYEIVNVNTLVLAHYACRRNKFMKFLFTFTQNPQVYYTWWVGLRRVSEWRESRCGLTRGRASSHWGTGGIQSPGATPASGTPSARTMKNEKLSKYVRTCLCVKR